MLRSLLTDDEVITWPKPDADVRWGIGAAAACFFAAQLLATLWVGAMINPLFGDEGLPTLDERPLWALPVLSIGLWVGYLFGPGLINRLTGSGPMVDFDLRIDRKQFVAAAVLGIVVQLLVLPPLYWLIGLVVDQDPSATATSLVERADNPLSIALLVFSVVIMAPLAEEWFYRGMLLSALVRRVGTVGGAVGSSVVFAVIHLEPILYPGLFVFAIVLAWLTIRTGRLGVAVVAHLTFNATTVVQLLVFG